MTQITIRYDKQTNSIKQSYWAEDDPSWVDEQYDGQTVTTTETSQEKRDTVISNALNNFEAGVDYDPDTERVSVDLCYNPDTDEIYAEGEIRPIES